MKRSDVSTDIRIERAFRACMDAAAETFAETTGLSRAEFEAVALVELADRVAQSEPMGTAKLLRKLADVIDPADRTSWLGRRFAMQDALRALRQRLANCARAQSGEPR